ncbi:NADH dehydrogenase [ubiquinone] 1 alpha subcomplex assembly factor 3 [Ceratina calcarata]|uniref:NADH dehydrogenase [ubiquinone] 1 alpha subcomplex assembly factor 3 n=1 Tax=Ceratina calcarata TaxID=156304 RepID=A0AAJ7JAE9_9HYME|nr:NADH dehydrogenase [ubiquinone] 1 alpha subcomplex assembly factor 3 [Ceratina calcarata]
MVLNSKLPVLRRLLQSSRQFHSSRIKKSYEGTGKTTIDIINKKDEDEQSQGGLLINKCLPIGFKLSDKSLIMGPMAIFPRSVLSWNVCTAKDINEETLSLFINLYPTLDLLILGLETKYEHSKITEMRKILTKHNIRVEILPVYQACGVYNFLTNEGRYIGAGLIPPLVEDSLLLKLHKKPVEEKKQIEEK